MKTASMPIEQSSKNKEVTNNTAAKVVLAGLAATGAIGMAGITIAKNKKLGNLATQNKELLNNLNKVQNEFSELQTSSNQTIESLKKTISDTITELTKKSKTQRLHESKHGDLVLDHLHGLYRMLRRKPEHKDAIQVIAEDIFETCGYKLVEYCPKNGDGFAKSAANIADTKTTAPALIDTATGDVMVQGNVVFPLV